jgi:hypothetical protein
MPVWFPFAILASFLVAMGTGVKAGFKTSAELAQEEEERKRRAGTIPTVQGVTFDRVNPGARHWWFWNTHFNGRVYQSKSLYLTGREALAEEQRVISNTNTVVPDPNVLWPLQASKRVAPPEMHRYIWEANSARWLRDLRSSRQLLAGNSLWGLNQAV